METIRKALRAMAVCAALAATPVAAAPESVVIYRCVDASGAVTIQNDRPCPRGSQQQQRRVLEAAPAPPAPPPPPPSPAAPTAPPVQVAPEPPAAPAPPEPQREPPPVIADIDRLPPPWLYECRTYNDDRYFSENGNPAPRCVTISTTGLGGTIESPNTSACEMKTDQCQRVPDGAVCDAWRVRLREAESALRFGAFENRAQAEADVARMTQIVRDSTCGMR